MSELQKSQLMRLWDVFALGPFMVYVGLKGKLSPLEKNSMVVLGILTVLYNGHNYIINRRLMREGKIQPVDFKTEIQL